MLRIHRVRILGQVRAFLAGAEPVEVQPLDRSACPESAFRSFAPPVEPCFETHAHAPAGDGDPGSDHRRDDAEGSGIHAGEENTCAAAGSLAPWPGTGE